TNQQSCSAPHTIPRWACLEKWASARRPSTTWTERGACTLVGCRGGLGGTRAARLGAPSRLFVFVRFSDYGRFALVIRLVFVLVIIVVVVIGVSRRHAVGDEAPVAHGEALGDALRHVGSLLGVTAFMREMLPCRPGRAKGRASPQGRVLR